MTLTPHSSCFSPAPSSYLRQTTPMSMPADPQSNSQSKSTSSNTIAHDDVIIQPVKKGKNGHSLCVLTGLTGFSQKTGCSLFLLHSHPGPLLPLSCSLTSSGRFVVCSVVSWSFIQSQFNNSFNNCLDRRMIFCRCHFFQDQQINLNKWRFPF